MNNKSDFKVETRSLFIEEEDTESLEAAASFGTVSSLGTAGSCASSLGTVSCIG